MKIKQRVWCWDFTFHQCCDGHVIRWSRCQLDDIANLSILKSHPESPPQTVRHDDLTSKNIFIRMHVCFLLVTFKQFRMCFFFFFFFAHQKKFFNVVLHFSIPHTLYLSYQCVMSTLSLIHHFLSLSPPLESVSSVLLTKPRYPVLAQSVWGSPKLSLVLKWSACRFSSPYIV